MMRMENVRYIGWRGCVAVLCVVGLTAAGAADEARKRGLELYSTCQEPVVFERIVRQRQGVDLRGILLDWARHDIAEFLISQNVPFVVVENDIEDLPLTAVIQDNAGGAKAMLEHMMAKGHQHIAILANNADNIHTHRRVAAYREVMLRAGLGVRPELIAQGLNGAEAAREATLRLLDMVAPPTAIFAASQGMLCGARAALETRGLAFPRDISLGAWGGCDEISGAMQQDVTHILWDQEDLGRVAMLALEERLRVGQPERMVFQIDTKLVDQGSVADLNKTEFRCKRERQGS